MKETITPLRLRVVSPSAPESMAEPLRRQHPTVVTSYRNVFSWTLPANKIHLYTFLILGGLLASIALFLQTNDAITKEGYKAAAVVLILCQLKNFSQSKKINQHGNKKS